MNKEVKTAFKALNDALLLAMASDWTDEKDSVLYEQLARTVSELERFVDEIFKRC